MARERLVELEWSLDDISFDLLAITDGPSPGEVGWAETGDRIELGSRAITRYLDESTVKRKKDRSLEDLILRRDEDLVGVSTAGDQAILVGNALPMMGDFTERALADAVDHGLEVWSLSFYEVINGVIYRRLGTGHSRHVSILDDDFVAAGDPLAFEQSLWDGRTPPPSTDGTGDLDSEDDAEEPCLEERLAKAALTDWLTGEASLEQFLQTQLTVFTIR